MTLPFMLSPAREKPSRFSSPCLNESRQGSLKGPASNQGKPVSTSFVTRFVPILIPTLALCLLPIAVESASAQVVQQPAFRTFSYTGGAWVPDQGTASLGGTNYARRSSVTRGWGPYAPRAAGSSRGGNSLSVSVQVIDLNALDEAMLNAPSSTPASPTDPNAKPGAAPAASAAAARQRLAGVKRTVVTTTDRYVLDKGIVTRDPNAYARALKGHDVPLQKAALPSQVEEDVRFYLQRGQEAEAANRINAARVYYQMAFEAMPPDLIQRYLRIKEERKKAAEQHRKDMNNPGRIRF